jgi:porphobilinogen deaminase
VFIIGCPDDKLQQALVRDLMHRHALTAEDAAVHLFHDDEDLRSVLGTTGLPYFESAFDALRAGEIHTVPVPGRFAQLYAPDGLAVGGVSFFNDPFVLVTQGGDDVLENPEGAFSVGSMSRTALGSWKNRFPRQKTVRVQTDVHTRLLECSVGEWDAGIFLKSELDLLSFEQHYDHILEEMLPEALQGFVLWYVKEGTNLPFETSAAAFELADAHFAFLRHLGAKPGTAAALKINGFAAEAAVFTPEGKKFAAQTSGTSAREAARVAAGLLLEQGAGEWVSGPHAED